MSELAQVRAATVSAERAGTAQPGAAAEISGEAFSDSLQRLQTAGDGARQAAKQEQTLAASGKSLPQQHPGEIATGSPNGHTADTGQARGVARVEDAGADDQAGVVAVHGLPVVLAGLPDGQPGTRDVVIPTEQSATATPSATDAGGDAVVRAMAMQGQAAAGLTGRAAPLPLRPGQSASTSAVGDDAAPVSAMPALAPSGDARVAAQGTLATASGGAEPVPAPLMTTAQESDTLFKQAMQQLSEAGAKMPPAALPGSAGVLSSVNTLQAMLQPASSASGEQAAMLTAMASASPSAVSSTPTGTATAGFMQGSISEAFGQRGWDTALGKQLLMMVGQNVRSAEIRMNPANLGPIEIQIELQDEQVNVAFSSRHAVVREAMELAMPRLREMLEANGLSLGNGDVSDQSLARHGDHAEAGERHGRGEAGTGEAASSDPMLTVTRVPLPEASSSMLDVYI